MTEVMSDSRDQGLGLSSTCECLDLSVGSEQLTCSAGSNSAASNTLQSAGNPKP